MKYYSSKCFFTAFSTLAILASASSANASYKHVSWELNLVPYIGLAAQGLHVGLPSNYGGNIFKTSFPQTNAFLGLRFSDYFGIEGGYETTNSKEQTTALPAGSIIMGNAPLTTNGNLSPILQSSKAQIKDWHLSFVAYAPISDQHPFKLLLNLGASGVKVSYFTYKIADPTNSTFNVFQSIGSFSGKKVVLKAGAGAQYLFSSSLGMRLTANWINTSRFATLTSKQNRNNKIQLKNAWNFGLGLFAEF